MPWTSNSGSGTAGRWMEEIEALQEWHSPFPHARREVRTALVASGQKLVVVDDDPTGTQTVRDVAVYLDWSPRAMREAITAEYPVFYVSTNSRSLSSEETAALGRELGRILAAQARASGVRLLIASRSDSTLRGHFPVETDALAEGCGIEPDGVIIAPAFFEGGRYTLDDVHFVAREGEALPVEQTEFARDPVFGYRSSNLRDWVEEKTRGRWSRDRVVSVSLGTLRHEGPDGVANILSSCKDGQPVIVNAVCYADFDTFVLGLLKAEELGKTFIYRCSASFVKSRGGFPEASLLRHDEISAPGDAALVLAGSYVERTGWQLRTLLDSGAAEGRELRVEALVDQSIREREIRDCAEWIDRCLNSKRSAVVYTSRARLPLEGQAFLEAGQLIMAGLCEVVELVTVRPASVVTKGGITSIEIARSALGAKRAWVLGQILPGVPVWRLDDGSRWPGVPLVVFPGNVGDDRALLQVLHTTAGGSGQ
ncbi:MAG: hypothetical protein KatS3mg024_0186 [Armatimonadota bacterium]|nr:MAG: hypothetical protein KatS3mg024_0186 [Armatimonadota bacterium]